VTLRTKLDLWQKDLIDMSRSNNLLYYRSTGRGSGIRLLVDDPNLLFDRLRKGEQAFSIDEIDKTERAPDSDEMREFIARLSRLRSRARDDLNNRGINTLYLAFGLLQWKEAEYCEEEICSPLILVPVVLSREGLLGSFQLRRLPEEDITINPTLREKLSHDFGIELPKFDELLQNGEPELEDRHTKQTLATMLHQLKAKLPRQLPCLERWLACAQQLQHCRDVGLSDLVEIILRERPFPRDIVDRFAKRFYTLWLDCVYQQSPVLARFRGEVYEHTIAHFCELDERHAKLAQGRLCASLRQRRREALAALDTDNACARAILALKSEVAKKRHRSIRSIVQKTAPGLLALKPCWMMSPLSVSQFLESGAPVFDLVIFDEASQVCAEDAICAILRGKQLIVVGDSKQLPPTRFFAKTLADIEDEDQPDDAHDQPGSERVESILDECLGASFPQRSLLWHYRSRHESLIAFSNHHFYYGRLITFPSPDARHSNGVRFEYVPDGIYDYGRSRTNRREAERVVDLILQHMQQQSGLSLGVVALSEAQQRAIQEAIEERLKCHPELRAWEKELNEDDPAGFFIKNLESVQGDERDVIILSVGYGPDANGRVHRNFGPVNRKGGERRLNVAVTRARHQVIVVSSMRAEDLPRDLASPGAQALRNYLEYAERGPAVLPNLMLTGNKDAEDSHQTWQFASPFEEAVYSALTARGLLLDTQVGCSGYRIDMAVRDAQHPGRYLLGIECDGATYHSSYTARDRDRLRQRQLEKMGWTIHRIWSTDWARNPAGEVEKVLAKLN
jgi:very-short-patch-repair endonuclease